jgi:hypothetical protein
MRKPGLKELCDLADQRRKEIVMLMPDWWPEQRREAAVNSESGRAVIRSVCAVLYQELCRIESEG